jgi:hypothetical protein|uniref:DUF3105 domain-containing protein n=1 Tax=Leptospirillum ferriphilum TaxID=178606 RepID=A0A7C3LTY5_9BACT
MKPRCKRPALVRHSLFLSVLIIILITSVCLSSCLPGMALADSSNGQPGPGGNGQNGGTGTFSPMPMFGSTFGGGDPSKPFNPIKSGIERFPSLGYSEASRPSDCMRYRYNSAPPTSGLYTRMYFDKNDLSGSVSPCEIVHVLYKGNILVFYDPARMDKESIASLKALETHLQSSQALISQQRFGYAVILVRSNAFKTPVVFAAWRRLLPMQTWDSIIVNRFMTSYLGNPRKGKGPSY